MIDREEIAERCPGAILYDGLDAAIVGIADRSNGDPVVCYDYEKLIECFVKDNDWDRDTAVEWVGFNIEGAYLGERTPIIVYTE